MEYVTKEEAIGMVHRVMGEYLLGQRVFYTDKDDILFDIDKSICAEIGKLPKCSILEGEFTVKPETCTYFDTEIGCCRKSEVPKAEWIPVSERLPEMDESVLICTDKGEMTVAYHTFKEWSEIETEWFVFGTLGFALTYEDDEVLAWMPLPKPWKGDEE